MLFLRIVLLLVAGCLAVFPASIVYVYTPSTHPYLRYQIDTAAAFYGINILPVVHDLKGNANLRKRITSSNAVAVIISADALPGLGQQQIFAGPEGDKHHVPLLIVGITDQTNPEALKKWSGGTIIDGKRYDEGRDGAWYAVGNWPGITDRLGGTQLPLTQRAGWYLAQTETTPWIMAVKSSGAALPILSKATVSGRDIFFAAASLPSMPRVTPNPYEEPAVFAALAPEMIFIRYAAGEQAWHAPGHYANLTIDDAWLREPYGHVNYQALLREMERHNFHTTLAFVPWNYDRSQPAVVDLFRVHPNRFSISIHGDNHDHQEFGPYKKRPLSGQITDIKQAIARMEKFSDLTGLSFDRVMVFPHSISPKRTLDVLKHYNFLATANSLNVPSDAAPPSNPLFALRTETLAFSNFPSLRRYSAEAPIPKAQLAVDAFLGNPLLFYVHQEYFASGSGAFDPIADTVNRLYPDAKWESLGYIASHLYLLKARADGNYDVRAYSSQISLHNPREKAITFYVRKAEDFHFPLSVSVDGRPYPYAASRCSVLIRVTIPAGKSRYVAVTYKNDFSRAKTDIAKTSPRIYAIRLLSDFRDDVVSRSSTGRWFIRAYSGREILWNDALTVILCLSIVAGVLLWHRNR